MKRRFKLKINGESPRSLLLAYALANLKCDVYIFDFEENTNSTNDYQIFLFSNSLKNLLSTFDIWNEIEDISYSFTSLSIQDNLVSEQLLLRNNNCYKKYLNTVGWIATYSDIKRLLINKLINFNNVQFLSKNQLLDESLNFDYEYNFKDYDKISNSFKLSLSTFKKIKEKIFIFNVYLRGHVEKRMYQINTTMGFLVLTPLNKNLYQVIWNNPSCRIKESFLSSKSLFLDNLSTLLPTKLKIDQIIGDINFLNVSNIYSNYLINNKSIYFNESKFKSNTLYNFNFDLIIKNILKIYNSLEIDETKCFMMHNNFRLYYSLRNNFEIKIKLLFANFLFYLFKINNIFSLFLRKLLFILYKSYKSNKNFVFEKFNIVNINNLFK